MEKYIHEPSNSFDFKRVLLKTPFSVGGGGFFSKFSIDGEPFYIKTPKCSTKQGFVKSNSKRYYCDLVFSVVDNEDFIRWMENLVSHSQQILLEKSDEWFQDPMNEHEIEDATISPLKSYRAGKFYLVRCNVPSTDDGSPEMKAYDENAREIPLASITENMDVITLLELRGIKCSLKSFQFEVNIKQIMAVKKINILETCLLGGAAAASPPEHALQPPPIETTEEKDPIKENEENPHLEDFEASHVVDPAAPETIDDMAEPAAPETIDDMAEPAPAHAPAPAATELEEVNLEDFAAEEKDGSVETIVLKNPNELYYNMYFEAKKRAKEARMSAITAYLEAKNIKMLYDLDDLEDSEDETDFMDFTDDDDSNEDDISTDSIQPVS